MAELGSLPPDGLTKRRSRCRQTSGMVPETPEFWRSSATEIVNGDLEVVEKINGIDFQHRRDRDYAGDRDVRRAAEWRCIGSELLEARAFHPRIMLVETSGPPKFSWSLLCPFAHVHATLAGRVSLTVRRVAIKLARLILNLCFCVTPYIAAAGEETDKTLVAWVIPANLNQQGGSALTIQSGDRFDAIVFGERARGRWMAGSNFFQRTQREPERLPRRDGRRPRRWCRSRSSTTATRSASTATASRTPRTRRRTSTCWASTTTSRCSGCGTSGRAAARRSPARSTTRASTPGR